MAIVMFAMIAVLATPVPSLAQRRSEGSSSQASQRHVEADAPRLAVGQPPRHAVPRSDVPRPTVSPRSGPASEGWPRDPLPSTGIAQQHYRSIPGVPPPPGYPQQLHKRIPGVPPPPGYPERLHKRIPGVPPPQIGLPLPHIGLKPHLRRSRHLPHRWNRSFAASFGWPSVYVVPQVVETYVTSQAPAPDPIAEELAMGRLVLDVQPASAQVFVDGYYVGTADDFNANRGGLLLETGPHRIDLAAPDHEQNTFDVRISLNQFVTYQQVLKPIRREPIVAPARSAPQIFYLIPGCYMGNVPPKEANLRPTCDPARAITFQQ
jgi:hypothetical protein